MTSLLLLDDASTVNDLFAGLLRQELGVDVVPLGSVGQLETELAGGAEYDFALIDLSFPEERRTGLDALLALHDATPSTCLAVITQGDSFVAQLLRDVWELLPIATVISKAAPIQFQIDQIRALLADRTAPVDPSVQPLLPEHRPNGRTLADFDRLVGHVGHAKLWQSLIAAHENVTYQDISDATGLRLNTVKNYRAQLLSELGLQGLDDPSLREMKAFADRCRPILERRIAHALAQRKVQDHPEM